MEDLYTFEDIAECIGALRKQVIFLAKNEYTGDDKDLLEQVAYELEKAKNVLE